MKVSLRQGLGRGFVRSTSVKPSRYTAGPVAGTMVRQRMSRRERSKRQRRRLPRSLATALLCCAAYDCDAIDRVILQVGQISAAGVQAKNATMTLDVSPSQPSSSPTLEVRAEQLRLNATGTTYDSVDILCANLLIKEPRYACNEGSVSARGGPTGQVAMTASFSYDSSTRAIAASGSGLRLAGAPTRFAGTLQADTWSLSAEGQGLNLAAARELAQPWLPLPPGNVLGGHVGFQLAATGRLDAARRPDGIRAHLSAHTANLNYSNQTGTAVGQNLATTLDVTVASERGKVASNVELQTFGGQVLAGTVLMDFGRNPLKLSTHMESNAQTLNLTDIHIGQADLLDAEGSVLLARKPLTVTRAHFDVQRLDLGAAYRSFLQIALATTDLGALNVGGRATGELDIANDAVSRVNTTLQNVSMADSTARLSLANANGELHWTADSSVTPEPSQLSWSSSSFYGLMGGPVQLAFSTRGAEFVLAANTRLPIFDGALVIHTLALRRLGAPNAELDFDAHLEPISMPLLSRAFGWPILSGQLAGQIPGVTYRDHVLAVQGDLSAHVFDGTLVGSHIELRDPLGPWPRLYADVAARRLDLDLLTHTFSIGSISGRLDADIRGLELFKWVPVAFDARLQTTPGDTSRHLISQKAVTSISSVGGGGGGVAATLQSGVLKFFDQFHYDRIGIRCQLSDEVCLMSGLEPARSGYYLVKGRGLPRIDIIGNAGRVDWTQLVGQIAAGMRSQNILVR